MSYWPKQFAWTLLLLLETDGRLLTLDGCQGIINKAFLSAGRRKGSSQRLASNFLRGENLAKKISMITFLQTTTMAE